jgi:hypothetical protein
MSTVDRLLRLWTEPVPETGDAIAAFGAVYADPVSVNGIDVPLVGLVERARALQRAFADLSVEIIDEVEAPNRLVVVFWQRGRHVGPLVLPSARSRRPAATSRCGRSTCCRSAQIGSAPSKSCPTTSDWRCSSERSRSRNTHDPRARALVGGRPSR